MVYFTVALKRFSNEHIWLLVAHFGVLFHNSSSHHHSNKKFPFFCICKCDRICSKARATKRSSRKAKYDPTGLAWSEKTYFNVILRRSFRCLKMLCFHSRSDFKTLVIGTTSPCSVASHLKFSLNSLSQLGILLVN